MYNRMDEAAFLGFDVWDFSLRSLARPYGWRFLTSVLLRHPWRSLAGMRLYRRRIRPARNVGGTPIGIATREAFLNELAEGDWMLGLGFCEKSLIPTCPAGRFNGRSSRQRDRRNSRQLPGRGLHPRRWWLVDKTDVGQSVDCHPARLDLDLRHYHGHR